MTNKYPDWLLYIREKVLNIFSKYSLPRWMVFLMDSFAVFMVFIIAYVLRFNFNIAAIPFPLAFYHALIAVLVFAVFSLIFHSYSGLLRHTTLTDISLVFIVTTISATSLLAVSLLSRTLNWGAILTTPISVILIHFVAITVFLFFVRVLIKIIFRFATSSTRDTKKVLIYGAGEIGFLVKRVIMSDPENGFSVVGFIDDDKNLYGKKINRIPVYGFNVLSRDYISKNKIEGLIIAVKDISFERRSRVINLAINMGLEVFKTPDLDTWLNGQPQAHQLQKVKLEDLLGRESIKLDMEIIGKGLNNRTILVTGAAGSIGSEIVRQLARFNTKKIILADQAETPMFHLEYELRNKYDNFKFLPLLADVTNARKMELIFKQFHPEIVFHAAAYKHVPLMEENPHEALRVNVGGTKIITELSVKYGVKKFVLISSDKSINPSSVMGVSKRVCEMVVQSIAQSEVKTQFVITRFGNVLGSNGSVIPLFTKQIEEGGPVTVTHPDITRYFMTIPEACELVLEAGFMGKGNEIFVFDMGKPILITDLANKMIQLSGFVPGKDIQIIYTGLRPGEKLYEELLTDKENSLPTHHPKIRIAQVEKFDYKVLLDRIDLLIKNVYLLSKLDIIGLFKELVPEYQSSNGQYNGNAVQKESTEVDGREE